MTAPTQALLIEDAVDQLEALLRGNFNAYLLEVWTRHEGDGRKIALEKVPPSNYFTSEQYTPFLAPAIFILADRSAHDLTLGQNWEFEEHSLTVAVLVEDIELARLTRKCWRFARACWMALHDQSFGAVHCLVDAIEYSPIFGTGEGDARRFRKDASLKVRVQHFEPPQ